MITIRLEGVDEVSESVLAIAEKMGIARSLEAVAERFEDRLRAATPVGFSGDLPSSVMSFPNDDDLRRLRERRRDGRPEERSSPRATDAKKRPLFGPVEEEAVDHRRRT